MHIKIKNGPGEPPNEGQMNEMTLPRRQNSKFEHWVSEADLATSWSRRVPTGKSAAPDIAPMSVWCWPSVADYEPALAQHCTNILSCHCPWSLFMYAPCKSSEGSPGITNRLPNVGFVFGQRRRRWTGVNPALSGRLVFPGES